MKVKSVIKWGPIYLIGFVCLILFCHSIYKPLNNVWDAICRKVNAPSPVTFADVVLIVGVFLAIATLIFYWKKKEKKQAPLSKDEKEKISKKYATAASPFIYDAPSDDDIMDRSEYARMLVDKIYSTYSDLFKTEQTKNSFVINVMEDYGMGKSSFFLQIDKALEESKKEYIEIDFKPWLCENPSSVLNEFFVTIKKELSKECDELDEEIDGYLKVLLESYSNQYPLLNLFHGKKETIKSYHDKIRDNVLKLKKPVIITIDDVDRLQPDEFISVLKIVRDTADFAGFFYIIAADRKYLTTTLESLHIDEPERYMQKFVNYEFHLPSNKSLPYKTLISATRYQLESFGCNETEITEIIHKIRGIEDIDEFFITIQDVNRFINQFTFQLDTLKGKNDNLEVDLAQLWGLTLVRYFYPQMYATLRDDIYVYLIYRKEGDYFTLRDVFRVDTDYQIEIKKAIHVMEKEDNEDNDQSEDNVTSSVTIYPFNQEDLRNNERRYTKGPYEKAFEVLNWLFPEDIDEKPIPANHIGRASMYFKYFDSALEEGKFNLEDVVQILNLPDEQYEQRLDSIFKNCQKDDFINEFFFASNRMRLSLSDMLSKYYIYLDSKFNNLDENVKSNYDNIYSYQRRSAVYDISSHILDMVKLCRSIKLTLI